MMAQRWRPTGSVARAGTWAMEQLGIVRRQGRSKGSRGGGAGSSAEETTQANAGGTGDGVQEIRQRVDCLVSAGPGQSRLPDG